MLLSLSGFDSRRLNLMVSACLLGQAVRYDGAHRQAGEIVRALGDEFHLVGVCPEVMAGLGIPRPPVQIVIQGETPRVCGVTDPALDVTQPLQSTSEQLVQTMREAGRMLGGVILKARSPSCGVGTTPWFNTAGQLQQLSSGVFAGHVLSAFPGLPVCDESTLTCGKQIQDFVERVRDYGLRSDSGPAIG